MLWPLVNPSAIGNLRGDDASTDAPASCQYGSAEMRTRF
jgi:hypothetical protein